VGVAYGQPPEEYGAVLHYDGSAWSTMRAAALPMAFISGGLKSFGHPIGATGIRMIYELVT